MTGLKLKDIVISSLSGTPIKTVNIDEFNKRKDICLSCENIQMFNTICGKCGCVIDYKAKYQESKCPVGKW